MQNKGWPPYVNSPWHKVAGFLWFNEAIWGKHWEKDVWLSGFALQSNSSICLVWILHRQLGNYLAGTGRSYGPTANISAWLYIGQYMTPNSCLHTEVQHSILYGVQVLTCSSDVCWKILPDWGKTLAQSTICRIYTSEMPATKPADTTACWKVPRNICAFAILQTFLTQEEIVLPHQSEISKILQ